MGFTAIARQEPKQVELITLSEALRLKGVVIESLNSDEYERKMGVQSVATKEDFVSNFNCVEIAIKLQDRLVIDGLEKTAHYEITTGDCCADISDDEFDAIHDLQIKSDEFRVSMAVSALKSVYSYKAT